MCGLPYFQSIESLPIYFITEQNRKQDLRIIAVDFLLGNPPRQLPQLRQHGLPVLRLHPVPAGGHPLQHVLVDFRAVVHHVHVIVQVADNPVFLLEAVHLHVLKAKQCGHGAVQGIEPLLQLPVHVGAVPPQHGEGGNQETVGGLRMG